MLSTIRLQCMLFILLCWVTLAFAESPIEVITLSNLQHSQQQAERQLILVRQQLSLLKTNHKQFLKQKATQWQQVIKRDIRRTDLRNAQWALINAQASLENINIALAAAQSERSATQHLQKKLTQQHLETYLSPKVSRAQQLLQMKALIKSTLKLQRQRIGILDKSQAIAKQQLSFSQRWHQQIAQLYQALQRRSKQSNISGSSKKLQIEEQQLIQQLNQLNQQLGAMPQDTTASQQKRSNLQFNIFIVRERITLNQLSLLFIHLRSNFYPNFILDPRKVTLLQLNEQISQLEDTQDALSHVVDQSKQKLTFLNKQMAHVSALPVTAQQRNQLLSLKQIKQRYAEQQLAAKDFQNELDGLQQQLYEVRQNQFSVRQRLPGLNLSAWQSVAKQLIMMPVYLWHSLQNAVTELHYQFMSYEPVWVYAYMSVLLLLVVGWAFLRKSCHQLLQALEESSKHFSSQLLKVLLRLLRRNLGLIIFIAVLSFTKMLFQLDIALWVSIAFIVLSYRLSVMLARLWLLETEQDVSGKDVRLYYHLKWIFGLGCFFAVIFISAYTFPVGYAVRVLCNKIFMGLLLALAIILFYAWSVLPQLIQKAFAVRRNYIKRVISLLCAVVPITLFTNAMIGLVGYVQLAWVIGQYQFIALSTLGLYMVVRGILVDAIDIGYNRIISNFKAGWLWAEAFVKPLERIVRIALFIVAILWFVVWSGLSSNPGFIEYVQYLRDKHLFEIWGNVVTLPMLLQTIIAIVVLYWFSKWSREFAFRWLYSKAKDIGVRNSLAIFTQYAVVIVGVILGLNLIGFNLKGFAVIAAGLAAGMGFGLRDLVSNFFSGILLLVERPFRSGDTITIGEFEGEVTDTGFRSMKIRTWDRMELIVPNADMFTKPFVNWTHLDSIVRTVVMLKVHRSDDPHRVQQLIIEVLKEIPCVVDEPAPEVFMKTLGDVLVEFEVRYFLNLQLQNSRPRVRSEVLFAIWDCFKKNGIQAPYPQYDVKLLSSSDREV